MTDPLSPARFAELADAYGGDIARWPAATQAQATAMAGRADMAVMLARARHLDARLDLWRVPLPSATLRQRVMAARPVHLSRRLRIWLSSLGIATALAGAAAGSLAATVIMTPADHGLSDEATAFGDMTPQEK